MEPQTELNTAESTPKPAATPSASDQNVKAALCYAFGFVSGIVFLVIEKDNKFIRFHAMQSTMTFLGISVLLLLPIIGWVLSAIATPLTLVLWAVLMYKAYQGEKFKLPVIGDLAEKQVNQ